MILLVDAGNTRVKWRVVSADASGHTLAEGAVGHAEIDMLAAACRAWPGLARVVGCNVAGTSVAARIATACAPLRVGWLLPTAACAGVRNLYENPERLGADRWAALIGARHSHAGPCLVVTAGTATTVDLLSAAGDFLGGLILPGVELMQQALARGTAQLPLAEGRFGWQARTRRWMRSAPAACRPRPAQSSACSARSRRTPMRSACSAAAPPTASPTCSRSRCDGSTIWC